MATGKPFPWWGWLAVLVALGGGGVAVYKATRGLRNNNPGNIRHGDKWQGMAPEQTDTEFIQFVSPEYGIRAMARILSSYVTQGRDTVRAIITRWAPPTENDTAAYIRAVSDSTGIAPDATIHLASDALPLVKAIIKHENGINPYADDVVIRGIALAGR